MFEKSYFDKKMILLGLSCLLHVTTLQSIPPQQMERERADVTNMATAMLPIPGVPKNQTSDAGETALNPEKDNPVGPIAVAINPATNPCEADADTCLIRIAQAEKEALTLADMLDILVIGVHITEHLGYTELCRIKQLSKGCYNTLAPQKQLSAALMMLEGPLYRSLSKAKHTLRLRKAGLQKMIQIFSTPYSVDEDVAKMVIGYYNAAYETDFDPYVMGVMPLEESVKNPLPSLERIKDLHHKSQLKGVKKLTSVYRKKMVQLPWMLGWKDIVEHALPQTLQATFQSCYQAYAFVQEPYFDEALPALHVVVSRLQDNAWSRLDACLNQALYEAWQVTQHGQCACDGYPKGEKAQDITVKSILRKLARYTYTTDRHMLSVHKKVAGQTKYLRRVSGVCGLILLDRLPKILKILSTQGVQSVGTSEALATG